MKIFYDVDTQKDFMDKDGALYVPCAELIKPALVALTDYAKKNSIPIVGSLDRHFGTEEYKGREQELQRWSGPFPDHCMNRSKGIEKIPETMLLCPDPRCSEDDYFGDSFCHPHQLDDKVSEGYIAEAIPEIAKKINYLWGWKRALYFEKQSYDAFTNPALKKFLEQAKVSEAVIYGVATDYCVKAAAMGMQRRGIQCYVVEDAIKGVAESTTETAIQEMKSLGCKFLTLDQILRGS